MIPQRKYQAMVSTMVSKWCDMDFATISSSPQKGTLPRNSVPRPWISHEPGVCQRNRILKAPHLEGHMENPSATRFVGPKETTQFLSALRRRFGCIRICVIRMAEGPGENQGSYKTQSRSFAKWRQRVVCFAKRVPLIYPVFSSSRSSAPSAGVALEIMKSRGWSNEPLHGMTIGKNTSNMTMLPTRRETSVPWSLGSNLIS